MKRRARRLAEAQEAVPIAEPSPEQWLSNLAKSIGWKGGGDLAVRIVVRRFLECRPSEFLRVAGPEGLLYPGFWQAVRELVECANQKRATRDDALFINAAREEIEDVCRGLLGRAGATKFLTNTGRLLFEFDREKAEGLTSEAAYRAIAETDRASGFPDSTPTAVKRAVSKARKERGLSGVKRD